LKWRFWYGKKGVIDRFEEDWAVVELEDGGFMDISISSLPPNAAEGSVVLIENHKVILLPEETRARKRHIDKLMEDLFED
jgi:Protein of unknown function (DUF3006).